jgi:hypothetical protein
MPSKPLDADMLSVHTYWDSSEDYKCPLCDQKIEYAFNDGGRTLVTLRGPLWVISNYYRCTNSECDLHKAFPMVHESMIRNKKFGKDVWERVVRYHFKTHLDYSQIKEILWDDTDTSISKSTIRNICLYFEQNGVAYLDQEILKEIQEQGYMILSTDGAQPKKGSPALWLFTDRVSQHTVRAELLDSASAPILIDIFRELEKQFGVPIKAVISDKQKNIVNAVKEFKPEIPHIYCQYHFLNHIMEPIQVKDSHIATQIKKTIRNLSIIVNLPKAYLNHNNPSYNNHYALFAPLAEELLNLIAVRGRKWEILPGIEMYQNIEYLISELRALEIKSLSKVQQRSINAVIDQLSNIITAFKVHYDEIMHLLYDTADLRKVLAKKRNSKAIKKEVRTWVYRLQSRLKRRELEYYPENLKYQQFKHDTPKEEIWQQWIRLEWSYHAGLYHSYDSHELEKTNNATERLINRTKRHFRKWLAQSDIQTVFENHGQNYAKLIELDYSPEQLNEIMWEQSVAFAPGNISPLESFRATIKRNWRISQIDTGNLAQLRGNLKI